MVIRDEKTLSILATETALAPKHVRDSAGKVVEVSQETLIDGLMFKPRYYLMAAYSNHMHSKGKGLEFYTSMTRTAQLALIAECAAELGFRLTVKETNQILGGNVYDEGLFLEWFKPIINPASGASLESACFIPDYTFETYGEDLDFVLSISKSDPGRVWTWGDADNGEQFIQSGYHVVNRQSPLYQACFITKLTPIISQYVS